jgi:hypothetical protein
MSLSAAQPEQLAERYLAAVDAFLESMRRVPADAVNRREREDGWSPRDIAYHVADVDQLLGLRLRHILGDDMPTLAAINTQANVEAFRAVRADRGLALDSLSTSSAMNAALIESLSPAQLQRKGKHPQGHELTAADVALLFAMHIEAHVRQLKRVLAKARGGVA